MKTATEPMRPKVQDIDSKYAIRIAMWERVGGGVFPSPTQIEALRKELNQQHPCLLHSES